MGKVDVISKWVVTNVWKIRANQKNTVLSIVFIMFVCHAIFIVTLQTGWVATSLNDEIGIEDLPSYEDSNTTMRILPVKKSYGSHYSNNPADSEIVTSEYGARIEVRYIPWPIMLNICYMEVLVYNGTPSADLDGWSLNISVGNQSGAYWFIPVSVVIPIHEPKTEITFEIHLLSTNFNETFPTPTLLNGMNFTYTVYYESSDLVADHEERILADTTSKLIWFLTLSPLLFTYTLPEREKFGFEGNETIALTPMSDAASMIGFLSRRIDNIDRERHYLAIETQILIVILGAIASYSMNTGVEQYLVIVVVILALPLVLSVIALIAGVRTDSPDYTSSLDSTHIVNYLKIELVRKDRFIGRIKTFIFAGSLYAIAIVLVTTFPQSAEYQYLAVSVSAVIVVILVLAILILLSLNIYRRLVSIEEYMDDDIDN